ncbi:DUF5993 family protein [Streptomyces gamaensis]|uniref:DUF5993 family protein n=1 Tax=Streptomyces gamaensis TaxID=1763542 RepID=A0ABW0YVL3_9ACTN
MDTLIFAGLLATMLGIVRRAARTKVLAAWWIMLALTLLLLAHHITSSLKLGLSY